MKVPVILTRIARVAAAAPSRVESLMRHGAVKVVSLLCRECGQWVNPNGWNPDTALCEPCTMHARLESTRYPNSGGSRRTGGWDGAR